MKELIVETKMSMVKFNFPTSLKELSNDYLKQVTDNITVAPNYSLIGLVYHERLAPLILTCRTKKKTANIKIVPIFIKAGKGDTSVVDDAKIGQKILIANSSLERGYQCATPSNMLNLDYFANVVGNSTDKDLYENAMQDADQREVFFVDFKVVANCDIIALYDDVEKKENPYIQVLPIDNKQNNEVVS